MLESSNEKKKIKITEATFKPKELKRELEIYRNDSLKKLVQQKTTNKKETNRSSSKRLKSHFLNDQNGTRTRYEQIL